MFEDLKKPLDFLVTWCNLIIKENIIMSNRELPFEVEILDQEPQVVSNPYTGESVTLEPDAVAVYDVIKGSELFHQYEDVRKGCDWFRKYEPHAYMVLLD